MSVVASPRTTQKKGDDATLSGGYWSHQVHQQAKKKSNIACARYPLASFPYADRLK